MQGALEGFMRMSESTITKRWNYIIAEKNKTTKGKAQDFDESES